MPRLPHLLGTLVLLSLTGCVSRPEPPPPAPTESDTRPAPAKGEPEEMLFRSFTTDQGQVVRVPANGDPWADRVVSYTVGKPKPQRDTDPKEALGEPDFRVIRKAGRHSVSLGHGGELVLEFTDNILVDGPGDDLVVFEVGKAIEGTLVDISTDGKDWVPLGQIEGAKSTIDIGPHVKTGQQFRFVRLTDARQGKSNRSGVAGADIDAVGAINMVRTEAPKGNP